VKKEYSWLKQESDAEIYRVAGQYYKFVWGYSTGSELGLHNEFDTDVCVYRWAGDDCPVDELPSAMDEEWETVEGFDVVEDTDGGIDWEDYADKVDKILSELEEG